MLPCRKSIFANGASSKNGIVSEVTVVATVASGDTVVATVASDDTVIATVASEDTDVAIVPALLKFPI